MYGGEMFRAGELVPTPRSLLFKAIVKLIHSKFHGDITDSFNDTIDMIKSNLRKS